MPDVPAMQASGTSSTLAAPSSACWRARRGCRASRSAGSARPLRSSGRGARGAQGPGIATGGWLWVAVGWRAVGWVARVGGWAATLLCSIAAMASAPRSASPLPPNPNPTHRPSLLLLQALLLCSLQRHLPKAHTPGDPQHRTGGSRAGHEGPGSGQGAQLPLPHPARARRAAGRRGLPGGAVRWVARGPQAPAGA